MKCILLDTVLPIAASVPAGDDDERVDGEANKREDWGDEWGGEDELTW